MPSHIWLVAGDAVEGERDAWLIWQDSIETFRVYYNLLGKLSTKFKIPRWYVETILFTCFRGVKFWWNGLACHPLVMDLDVLMDLPYREVEKAVSRWARKFEGLMFYLKENLLRERNNVK